MKSNKTVQIGLESKVTLTNNITLLGTMGIPAKFAGTEGTITKVRNLEDGYNVNEEFIITMPGGYTYNIGRTFIQNAGTIKPFGRDSIEEARRVGGNASIQGLLNQRISAGTSALTYACQDNNKNFKEKIATAEKNIREAKMLFASLTPAPKQ